MRTSITLILERKTPFQNIIYFQQRCCTNLFSGGYDDALKEKGRCMLSFLSGL